MGKFITNFATTAELATASAKTDGSFGRPHVSLTKDNSQVHFFGDPCKSEIVKTTYEWVEIGGIKWATKNVGAKTITDFGQKFSWGGVNGYTNDQVSGSCHSKAFSWTDYEHISGAGTSSSAMTKYNSTDGLTTLEVGDDAAVANMEGLWRMPTEAEFNELLTASTITKSWTSVNGVRGYKFSLTADPTKYVFFPAAGGCSNSSVSNAGSVGHYWSSSLDTSNVIYGRSLVFSSGNCKMSGYNRYYGYSVRGVVG